MSLCGRSFSKYHSIILLVFFKEVFLPLEGNIMGRTFTVRRPMFKTQPHNMLSFIIWAYNLRFLNFNFIFLHSYPQCSWHGRLLPTYCAWMPTVWCVLDQWSRLVTSVLRINLRITLPCFGSIKLETGFPFSKQQLSTRHDLFLASSLPGIPNVRDLIKDVYLGHTKFNSRVTGFSTYYSRHGDSVREF